MVDRYLMQLEQKKMITDAGEITNREVLQGIARSIYGTGTSVHSSFII